MGYEPADPRRSVLDLALPRVPADDAVAGFTVALFVAVAGAAPWALGVLIFQRAQGWQTDAGQCALLLADVIVAITAVVVAVGVVRSRAAAAGDTPAADGLDPAARELIRRTQNAVHAVKSARIFRDGLIDEPATTAALAAQLSEIADALREQARLRAERSGVAEPSPGSRASELLEQHRQAAREAHRSIVSRVAALERYAAEVRQADADYRDWRQHAAISELTGPHLDMLARTAADEYRIAELTAMIDQARSVRRALREPRD
jgi:hypothetical protein